MGTLSVIVPVYNGEKYLEETIKYIQSSEYQDLEIIIVNDGSTDSSLSIATKMQCSDARIVIYNKDNSGVVSSREYGVERAKGDFICFVDQDDIVKPFMYSKLIHSMEKYGSDMSMCSSGRSIDGNESVYDIQNDDVYLGDDIRLQLLYPILFNGYKVPFNNVGGGNHYPHIWTCVFRTRFWRDNGIKFRAYVNYEDDLLVKVEALSKANKVNTISDIGYLWRVNLKSQTYTTKFVKDISCKQEQSYQDILKNLKRCHADEEILKIFKQVTYCQQYVAAVHNLLSCDIKLDRKFIIEYMDRHVYNRDFTNAIEGREYLKKGRIKPKVLLLILLHKRSMLCYYAEQILDKILMLSLHFATLTKIERMMKK